MKTTATHLLEGDLGFGQARRLRLTHRRALEASDSYRVDIVRAARAGGPERAGSIRQWQRTWRGDRRCSPNQRQSGLTASPTTRLQNLCGRVAHGSVGSTPAPLRQAVRGSSRSLAARCPLDVGVCRQAAGNRYGPHRSGRTCATQSHPSCGSWG